MSNARFTYSLAAVLAHPLDGVHLVLEDGLGVVEKAPNEGALPVVDRPGSGETQNIHGLEVPLTLAIFHRSLAELVVTEWPLAR